MALTSETTSPNTKKRVSCYEFDTVADVIGKGSYGEVYRATVVNPQGGANNTKNSNGNSNNGNGVVALKRTMCAAKEEGMPASTMREIMVLKEISKVMQGDIKDGDNQILGSNNVVKLLDVLMDKNVVYMVTEYCEAGDLSCYLKKQPKNRISDPQQYRQWMRDLLRGICYLHAKEFSHRDLKPQNIVLKLVSGKKIDCDGRMNKVDDNMGNDGDDYILKITDFGLSRVEGIPVKKYQHEAVTLWYRSPDLLLGNTCYSYTADMWSAGCIIAETASGNALFRGRNDAEQLKCIFSRLGPPTERNFPSMKEYTHYEKFSSVIEGVTNDANGKDSCLSYSHDGLDEIKSNLTHYFRRYGVANVVGEDGLDLISRLLLYEPRRRLTAEEALHHPFFTILSRSITAPSEVIMELESTIPMISNSLLIDEHKSINDFGRFTDVVNGNGSEMLRPRRPSEAYNAILHEQQEQQHQKQKNAKSKNKQQQPSEEITRGGTKRGISARVNGSAMPKPLGASAVLGSISFGQRPQVGTARPTVTRNGRRI
ncbi:Protein kinase domain [Trypanosoma melophagium]|uniref:Protein kinase domain n=1 Tax=Trypanosoma melophagium TaxID=715481 RepID=UPI00351A86F7|nr:Protein kinase domain [Trypanosoma melophagium]